MEFSVTYFDDEVREGFYVSGLMKRIWAAQLEVYLDVVKVCEKHNIRWFADYGSLLGAVRHGGYIPWDDDFDICMLRDDYMRFIKVVGEELPSHYLIKNCHTTKDDFLTRIDNSRIPRFDEDFLGKYHNCHLIAGIDVFPLDYMAPEGEQEEAHKFLLQAILSFREFLNNDSLEPAQLEELLCQLEQMSGAKFDRSAEPMMQVYQAAEAVCAVYGPEKATRVMLAAIWATSGTKTYPLSCFKKSIMMPFEGIEIPVSAEYDTMLQIEYGNYMNIVKGGASHDYPCFEEQEGFCIENIPDYKFVYKYDPEALKEVKRLPGKKPMARALRYAELMMKAHNQMKVMATNGDLNKVLQLLETSQNGAINIGTLIEEAYGEGFVTVGILEKYCEALYQVSEALNDSGDVVAAIEGGCRELNTIMDEFCTSVQANMHDKKEILMIPYRASTWETMEPIWERYSEDEDCDVYVILPPYYERTGAGGFSTMHDESALLPDYVQKLPYDAYDFEERHPDMIYIQNPYDECNYTTSVHPFFYSKNLKQYTEKLVYVPWFIMDEFDLGNGKTYQTMQYFCTVPGLFYADEVLLQSEQMRKNYIERLTEFAGEETRAVWEAKIKGNGVTREAVINRQNAIKSKQVLDKLPDSWRDVLMDKNGDYKKIVVYDITPQAFAQGGKNAIDKIKSTLQLFEKNKDRFVLLWRENAVTRDMLHAADRKLQARYEQLVASFKEAGYGIYDELLTYEEEAYLADAYYGDAGYVARRFEMLGKPVMIQDIKPVKKAEMINKVELRRNENGDFPFHVRACVRVEDDLYVFPDEMNALCKIRMEDGQIELIDSIPDESINKVGLVSWLEYYRGKLVLVPCSARCLWMYDLETGTWEKLEIENENQDWKFSSSVVYNDTLYMFPNWYKYIVRVDLKQGTVKYYDDIYRDYKELEVHEQCIFRPDYVLVGSRIILLNPITNLILDFNLDSEAYQWTYVGDESQPYNSVAYDGEGYYFVPQCGASIGRWDGHTQCAEIPLPKECQYVFDGLVSASIRDDRLCIWGLNCNSIEMNLQEPYSMLATEGRYRYIFSRGTMCFRQTYSGNQFIYEDGDEYQFDTVFAQEEVKRFVDDQLSQGVYDWNHVIHEDDLVDVGYFLQGMEVPSADRKEKIKIVFLPYNASMWDSLESIWMAAKDDPDCEAYVVPIPYYDKNGKGELTEYHYEGDKFPEYVPITDYRQFDLAVEKPDVIYIHNPYDNGNHVTSIDPAYYSDELKKYTNTLVYVPYYATTGGMSVGQSLCRAYLNADYIIVQAEKHKGYFDKRISRDKILALGSPKFDRVVSLCKNPPGMPTEWKNQAEGKRVIFYNTSLHGMLDNTGAFFDKMEYVFSCFEGRDDVCLLWRPHPLFETTIDSVRPEYRERYQELKAYFIERKLGIYDTTSDIEKTIALCDAYIGDAGTSVTSLFGIAGKPIFILNNGIHNAPGEEDWLHEAITLFYPQGQDAWKIAQGNKLYHAENEDYQYAYYCDLSEYSAGGYYRYAILRDDGVYVFPMNAQDILYIDWEKKIHKIVLERKNEHAASFAQVHICGDYVFLIPCRYPYIVRFHMRTREVDYIDGCQEFVASLNGNEIRVGGSAMWNGYLLVASPIDKRVIAIDVDTLELQVLSVDAKHYRGACAIGIDEDEVWLLPYTGTNVIRWNPLSGDTREYNCRVDGFTCNRRPQGNACMEKAFGSLVATGNYVVLAPLWGNRFVKIDKHTGTVSTFETDMNLDYLPDNGYAPSGGQGCFLRKKDSHTAVFYHEMNRKLYELNLKTGSSQAVNIAFSKEEYVRHEPGYARCSEWFQYGCMENACCTLRDFLDDTLMGSPFDKEEQQRAFGEIAVNGDGSCGEKIHAFIMSKSRMKSD